LRKNNDGYVEIGYIYVLIISALVFVSFTTILTDKIDDETKEATKSQLESIGNKLTMNINNAINLVNTNNNSVLDINIPVPTAVTGYSYSILIKDNTMYLNCSATVISLKFHLINSIQGIETYDELDDEPSSLSSSYGSINIIYAKNLLNGKVLVT